MQAIVYCGYTKWPKFSAPDSRYPVTFQRCTEPGDYERGLRALWEAEADLVVIEHDIEASNDHVQTLLDCPYILCAQAYYVYPVSHGGPRPVIPHREWIGEPNRLARFIEPKEEWADLAGLGLTKFSRLARQAICGWSEDGDWRNLDQRVAEAFRLAGHPFHIHWPAVNHFHQ